MAFTARRPHPNLLRPLPLPVPAPHQPNPPTQAPIPTIATTELPTRTPNIQSILNLENEKDKDRSRDAGGARTVEEGFLGGDVEGQVEWGGGGNGQEGGGDGLEGGEGTVGEEGVESVEEYDYH